jgi:hypothetical protein
MDKHSSLLRKFCKLRTEKVLLHWPLASGEKEYGLFRSNKN